MTSVANDDDPQEVPEVQVDQQDQREGLDIQGEQDVPKGVGGPLGKASSVPIKSAKEMLIYMREKAKSKETSSCEGSQSIAKVKANQKQSQAGNSVRNNSQQKGIKFIKSKGSAVNLNSTKVRNLTTNYHGQKTNISRTPEGQSIISSKFPIEDRLLKRDQAAVWDCEQSATTSGTQSVKNPKVL